MTHDSGLGITHLSLYQGIYLLVGTTNGTIQVYPWPLQAEEGEEEVAVVETPTTNTKKLETDHRRSSHVPMGSKLLLEFSVHCHQKPITRICTFPEMNWIFTSAGDGCISKLGWDIPQSLKLRQRLKAQGEEGNTNIPVLTSLQLASASSSSSGSSFFSEEVLINREEIDELSITFNDMQVKYDQTKSDMGYALHRQETSWVDRLKIAKEEAEKILLVERQRFKDLQDRYEATVRTHGEEMSRKNGEHLRMTQDLQTKYEQKLSTILVRSRVVSDGRRFLLHWNRYPNIGQEYRLNISDNVFKCLILDHWHPLFN